MGVYEDAERSAKNEKLVKFVIGLLIVFGIFSLVAIKLVELPHTRQMAQNLNKIVLSIAE